MKNIITFWVSGFFSGFFPFMPGTIGSIVLVSIFTLFYYYDFFNLFCYLFTIHTFISFIAVKIYLFDKTNKDPKEVVVDEFLGQAIVLIGIVLIFNSISYTQIFLAFLLFRFFDIVKIFPVNWFDQKLKNYWGVMLDDVVAAIYALLCAVIVIKLFSF